MEEAIVLSELSKMMYVFCAICFLSSIFFFGQTDISIRKKEKGKKILNEKKDMVKEKRMNYYYGVERANISVYEPQKYKGEVMNAQGHNDIKSIQLMDWNASQEESECIHNTIDLTKLL